MLRICRLKKNRWVFRWMVSVEREDSTVCGKLFHSFRPTIENTLVFFAWNGEQHQVSRSEGSAGGTGDVRL